MKLHRKTLEKLAELICGGGMYGGFGGAEYGDPNFPYRSSSQLTRFFCEECELDFVHGGSTRKWWVLDVLNQLNDRPSAHRRLPSDDLVRVLGALMDEANFDGQKFDRDGALQSLTALLKRDGLQPSLGTDGTCYITVIGGPLVRSEMKRSGRVWSKEQVAKYQIICEFLDTASEDEFTESFLAPLFRQMDFQRISVSGHRDKSLEYGVDLWMKYQIPTGHYLYFAVQVKRGKIDSSASSRNHNVAEILAQIRMMIGKPLFDPESNRDHLLDHAFIVASGVITKATRTYIGRSLDQEMRRHIIFMDREDLAQLAIDFGLSVPVELGDHSEATTIF